MITSLKHIREILQQYQEVTSWPTNWLYLNLFLSIARSKQFSHKSTCLEQQLFLQKWRNYETTKRLFSHSHGFNKFIELLWECSSLHKRLYFHNLGLFLNSILLFTDNPHITDPESFLPDGRYNHVVQIQERLNFMKYLLKEGALWLLEPQAEGVWKCLAQNSIFQCDREFCFKWFSKLMHDDPDLEADMIQKIFEDYITQLDPKLLTDSGIKWAI